MSSMNYPNIERAHLEIAYDNGGINRYRTAAQATEELRAFLADPAVVRDYGDAYQAMEDFLACLTDGRLEVVCNGEESERNELLEAAPTQLDAFLTEIFDHVC